MEAKELAGSPGFMPAANAHKKKHGWVAKWPRPSLDGNIDGAVPCVCVHVCVCVGEMWGVCMCVLSMRACVCVCVCVRVHECDALW
jgi:hypothetical protein